MDPTLNIPGASLATASFIGILASIVMQVVKPFIEKVVPNTVANQSTHDAVIRLAVLLLNLGVAFGYAAALGQLSWQHAFGVAAETVYQFGWSLGMYHGYTAVAGSGGSAPSAPVAAPDPKVTQALVKAEQVVQKAQAALGSTSESAA